jgi:acetyl-CoA acetyltransferase
MFGRFWSSRDQNTTPFIVPFSRRRRQDRASGALRTPQKRANRSQFDIAAYPNTSGTDKVDVNGGAIAIGHQLGASGARIATTLVKRDGAERRPLRVQTMCEAGGPANAMVLEAV